MQDRSAVEALARALCGPSTPFDLPRHIAAAEDVIAALAAAGFVVVPREPTEAMQDAGAHPRENRKPIGDIWRAMIDAYLGAKP